MIPKSINKNHILEALREISEKGVPRNRRSRKYIILHKGKQYPSKYVVSLASKFATGTELDSSKFEGGAETTRFLKRLGFEVIEKSLRSHLSNLKNRVSLQYAE